MEETVDDAPEDGATSRVVSAALLRPPTVFCVVRAVLLAAGVRVRRPDARRRRRVHSDGGVAH